MSGVVSTNAWLTGPSSTSFYTETFRPLAPGIEPRAVLVFIHGFVEHIGRYSGFFGRVASRGVGVFSFDQRGFGRTVLDEEKRSKGSVYGKTTMRDQLVDAEWAIGEAKKTFPGLPVFLMGCSMGGGIVLSFCTRAGAPPAPATVAGLAGVIASSPMLRQTHPANRALRWAGGKASLILPHAKFPAEIKPEHISHDTELNNAYLNDPLIQFHGTLKGISDMLNGGDNVLDEAYKNFPKTLPLLLLHGTEDHVTSPQATEEFYKKVDATDKKLSLYEAGYHELQNEPEGVKEKWADECIAWIEAHVPAQGEAATAAPAGDDEATAAKL